jgi:uncharacterized protein
MITKSSFKPFKLLANKHLQTILSSIGPQPLKATLTEENIELPDGDFIECHMKIDKPNQPIVIILHGLGGNIRSHYSKLLIRTVLKHEMNVVFMHFRGANKPNRSNKSYHAGDTDAFAHLCKLLKQRYPTQLIKVVGVSLGGNVVLKYAGDGKHTVIPDHIIVISTPFDLLSTAQHLNSGIHKMYRGYLLKKAFHTIYQKFHADRLGIPLKVLESIRNFADYDALITAPLHGFKDAQDYYTQCSCRQYLKNIKTPTLIIQAKDDPFVPFKDWPTEAELSPSVTLEASKNGGHVGFIGGSFSPHYWLEWRVAEALKA